ncbi:unnamed protein product [Linum trigynum]|uniref:Gnk2-homologous domain-containing protein n=1 Tax=Linum trigynum TaxID=586398 RepID=A0AAV2FW40_9ROSI
MEYYNNYASAARNLVVAVAMIVVVVVGYGGIGGVEADSGCGHNATDPAMPPCRNHYALCIDEVISGLRDTTPTKEGFFDSKSVPGGGFRGAVTGSASCVPGTSVDNCKYCLSTAKKLLDECRSVTSGSFSNDVCTMWYGQIM